MNPERKGEITASKSRETNGKGGGKAKTAVQ